MSRTASFRPEMATPAHPFARLASSAWKSLRPPGWALAATASVALLVGVTMATYCMAVISWHYYQASNAIAKPAWDYRMAVMSLAQKALLIASDPAASFTPQGSLSARTWRYASPGRGALTSSEATLSATLPNDLPTNLIGRFYGFMRRDSKVSVTPLRDGDRLVLAFKGLSCLQLPWAMSPYGMATVRAARLKDLPEDGNPGSLKDVPWSYPGMAQKACEAPSDGKGYMLIRFEPVRGG